MTGSYLGASESAIHFKLGIDNENRAIIAMDFSRLFLLDISNAGKILETLILCPEGSVIGASGCKRKWESKS
jgi:hypothetical protein